MMAVLSDLPPDAKLKSKYETRRRRELDAERNPALLASSEKKCGQGMLSAPLFQALSRCLRMVALDIVEIL